MNPVWTPACSVDSEKHSIVLKQECDATLADAHNLRFEFGTESVEYEFSQQDGNLHRVFTIASGNVADDDLDFYPKVLSSNGKWMKRISVSDEKDSFLYDGIHPIRISTISARAVDRRKESGGFVNAVKPAASIQDDLKSVLEEIGGSFSGPAETFSGKLPTSDNMPFQNSSVAGKPADFVNMLTYLLEDAETDKKKYDENSHKRTNLQNLLLNWLEEIEAVAPFGREWEGRHTTFRVVSYFIENPTSDGLKLPLNKEAAFV